MISKTLAPFSAVKPFAIITTSEGRTILGGTAANRKRVTGMIDEQGTLGEGPGSERLADG